MKISTQFELFKCLIKINTKINCHMKIICRVQSTLNFQKFDKKISYNHKKKNIGGKE